jgi:hypothetical protein
MDTLNPQPRAKQLPPSTLIPVCVRARADRGLEHDRDLVRQSPFMRRPGGKLSPLTLNYDGPVPPRLRSRQPQVDVLRGQLNTLGAGRGGVVPVTGPAGAGKTTLLDEAASLAADRGVRVFCGGGDPAARAVPLGAILDAFVSAVDPPVDPARVRELTQSPDQRSGCCANCRNPLSVPLSAPRC